MKYILTFLIFLICNISLFSQDIKQFKNSKNIKIEIKNDTIINIDNEKTIKCIYKQLKNINFFSLDNSKWFNSKNWEMKLTFDLKEDIIFYSGGFVIIGKEYFFTSTIELKNLKKIIR